MFSRSSAKGVDGKRLSKSRSRLNSVEGDVHIAPISTSDQRDGSFTSFTADPPTSEASERPINLRRDPRSSARSPSPAPAPASTANASSRNNIFFSSSSPISPPEPLNASASNYSVTSLESLGHISVGDSSTAGDTSQSGTRLGLSPTAGTLTAPATDLHASASIRSQRNWDEFEGKPVSPLPSPAVQLGPADDPFDRAMPSKKDSTDSYSSTNGRTTISSASQNYAPPEMGSKNWSIFGTTTSSSSLLARAPSVKATKLSSPMSRGVSLSDPPETATPLNAGANGPWSSSLSGGIGGSGAVNGNLGGRVASADLSHRVRLPSRLPTLPSEGQIAGTTIGSAPSTNSRSISALYPSAQGFGFPRHARISSGDSTFSTEPLPSPLSAVDPAFSANGSIFSLNSTSQISLSGISDVPSATYDGLAPTLPGVSGSPHRTRTGITLLQDDNQSAQSSPVSAKPPRLDPRPHNDAGEASSELESQNLVLPAASTSDSGRRGKSRHTQGPSEIASGSSILPSPASRQKPTSNPILEQKEEEEEGDRIGPYRIEKTLGVGAFSRVALGRLVHGSSSISSTASKSERLISSLPELRQRARLRRRPNDSALESPLEELVALKMLDREPCNNNERLKVSWVREVEVLKHISHPNLVRFITSFSTPLHHTLVLEQVVGGELFEALMTQFDRFAEREWLVRTIYSELANAVGWMHHVNLVHRDIKLENILMTTNLFEAAGNEPLRPHHLPSSGPLVKLTDFGLSRFIDPSNPMLETRCGSEEYAAPELIIGKKYDGRKTDSWALGVVLYSLITGSLPFMEDVSVGVNGAREGHGEERDPRQRKRHLLRIAKGDLRWPATGNDACSDAPDPTICPANLRLVTPMAKAMVARLLRRDATKRATAWETWDEPWLLCGSFGSRSASTAGSSLQYPNESSAGGESIHLHPDPRSQQGQLWLDANAHIRQDDVSQLACDD